MKWVIFLLTGVSFLSSNMCAQEKPMFLDPSPVTEKVCDTLITDPYRILKVFLTPI